VIAHREYLITVERELVDDCSTVDDPVELGRNLWSTTRGTPSTVTPAVP
jgi:hypothetical protein